jgi:hypothetical protein
LAVWSMGKPNWFAILSVIIIASAPVSNIPSILYLLLCVVVSR